MENNFYRSQVVIILYLQRRKSSST